MENILIFNAGYTPAKTYGGPVVSISNLVKSLHEKFNFTIITNSTEINSDENIDGIDVNLVNLGEYSEEILYLDKKHYDFKFIESAIFKSKNFDLIYVNSFFNFKQLKIALYFSNKYNIPMLIAPRGELEKNAFNIKKNKKIVYSLIMKFIFARKNVYFQATTEEEYKNINTKLGISVENIVKLKNIPTTLDSSTFKQPKIKAANKLDVCFISRIQTKKNLDYALKVLKQIDSKYQVKFDIYGPIENKQYWENCIEIINSLPSHITVNYQGIVSHDEILNTFSNYDLFLFPTKSENFGHVIYESLAAGCPVLISDQTPWNDINNTNAGKAIPLNDKQKYENYINDLAQLNQGEYKTVRYATSQYLKDKINTEEIRSLYVDFFTKITK